MVLFCNAFKHIKVHTVSHIQEHYWNVSETLSGKKLIKFSFQRKHLLTTMNEFVLAQMDISLIYAFRFKSINEAEKVDVKRTNRKRKKHF